MEKITDAAKPSAGKKIGANAKPPKPEVKTNGATGTNTTSNDVITAEIGKVWVQLRWINGRRLIEISTDCSEDLNSLCEYAWDEHHVDLQLDDVMDVECFVTTEVEPEVHDAVRKWIANNTNWRFTREVDDSDLIDDED